MDFLSPSSDHQEKNVMAPFHFSLGGSVVVTLISMQVLTELPHHPDRDAFVRYLISHTPDTVTILDELGTKLNDTSFMHFVNYINQSTLELLNVCLCVVFSMWRCVAHTHFGPRTG
jgi:hypothetical protein